MKSRATARRPGHLKVGQRAADPAGMRSGNGGQTGMPAGLRGLVVPVLLAAVLLAVWGAAAEAQVYRWVDEDGVPHFSDRAEDVPPGFQYQLDLPVEEEPEPADEEAAHAGSDREKSAESEPQGLVLPKGLEALQGKSPGEILAALPTGELLKFGVVILVLLAFAVGSSAGILMVACPLAGQESPGFLRACAIVVLQTVLVVLAQPLLLLLTGPVQRMGGALLLPALQIVLALLLHAAALRLLLCRSFGRALAVAVATTLVVVLLGVLTGVGLTCGLGGMLLGAGG